jgi:hypothetical protein
MNDRQNLARKLATLRGTKRKIVLQGPCIGRFFGQPSGTDANKILTVFQMLALENSQNWPDKAIVF